MMERGPWWLWRKAWAGLALIGACAAAEVQAGLPETVARIKPGVVGVGTWLPTGAPPFRFRGTGFAVGDGRHVLTAAHVVAVVLDPARNERLAVLAGSGRGERRWAEKVAVDPVHDLALLRITGPPLRPLRLGRSSRVREGEEYAFTGFPLGTLLGLHAATHRATVAAIAPAVMPQATARRLDPATVRRLRSPFRVLQLDATAYPGNSGSPLYDMRTGKVIGLVNQVVVRRPEKGEEAPDGGIPRPGGITYAIPIDFARPLLERAGVRH